MNVIVARSVSCTRGEEYEARALADAERSSGGNRGKSSKPKSAYEPDRGMGS